MRLDAEIISADSRAFFAGLDIVTDKPDPAARSRVPHHLVDRVPWNGEYDAMAFRKDVARLVPQIVARQRTPLIVGGGTLYLGAVLRGLFAGPGKSASFRASLDGTPTTDLHARLGTLDPRAAAAIHENDRLRIIRALEVHAQTGRCISELQADAHPLPFRFHTFGLGMEREQHRAAIRRRVESMIDRGLLAEVARLREDGLTPRMQAYRTIGVPEAAAVLDGIADRTALADQLVHNTWSLVRRQRAWFRRMDDVTWIDVTDRAAEDVARQIESQWETEREAG